MLSRPHRRRPANAMTAVAFVVCHALLRSRVGYVTQAPSVYGDLTVRDRALYLKTLGGLDYAFVSTGVVQRGNGIWAVQIFWAKPREKGIFQ